MKTLKLLGAAVAAMMMTFTAEAAKTAKAVVADSGATLKFVYDATNYGAKGTDWFSVADAEAINPLVEDVPWYGKREKVTKVVFDASFKDYQPTQCGSWFYEFENLATIVDIGNLDTSAATSFAYMFSNCSALTSLDVTGFDTSAATSFADMFSNCSALTSLDVTGFDTSKVTNMSFLFYGCKKLEQILVSDAFTIDAVATSSYMFYNCTSLKGGAGTAYDSTKIDKTYARIDGKEGQPGYFTEKTAKVVVEDGGKTLRFVYDGKNYGTKDTDWFAVADAEAIDPSHEDVPWYGKRGTVTKVVFDASFKDYQPTQCGCWFYYFEQLSTIENIGNLDTSAATSFASMFQLCSSLTTLDVTGFDTAKVTSMRSMFKACRSLASLDVSGFDTSKVTDMNGMFYKCWSLTSLDVSGFNTANVTDMSYMFYSCSWLTSLDVSGFNTANVTDMSYMFYDCSSLTSITASDKFVTTAVTDSGSMFEGCSALKGGNGTAYDSTKTDATYARIDKAGALGYFSLPPTAKVVVEDDGATLRFVYDGADYGTKGTDWFAVADAEAIDPDVENVPWYDRREKVTKVVFDASFKDYQPTQCGRWFYKFGNLATIEDFWYLDTSAATSFASMFYGCSSLTSLDVSGFNTAKVKNMISMFSGCSSLASITVSDKFVTTSVTSSDSMFKDCTALKGGNGTAYDSTKTDKTFARIDGKDGQPGYFTPPPPVAKVVVEDGGATLRFVYDGANYGTKDKDWFSVAEAEINDPYSENVPWYGKRRTVTKVVFDASFKDYQPTQCGCWFCNFESLATIENIWNLDTSAATSLTGMFWNCSLLTTLDVTGFDTSKVTDMYGMFLNCSSLTTLDVTGFDTANVTDMSRMFFGCSLLTTLDVTGFDTSNVTEMYWMFLGCSSLTTLDVTGFDTSKVTNMQGVFDSCSSLTSLDVTGFDTAKVTCMCEMFEGCSSLTSLDVSGFDTSNVTSIYSMFSGCSSLTSLDVTGFDTAKVTYMSAMFSGCSSLTTLDVTGFDTSKVTTMHSMFDGCSSLTSIAASDKFVTTAVTRSDSMFKDCTSLKGGNGTAYDSTKTDKTYARIDGTDGQPGYFTTTLQTVTFNANGGVCGEATRQVAKNAAVGTLPTATRAGYTFDGWFTAASGGTPVTAATVVTAAVAYYAHWTLVYVIPSLFDAVATGGLNPKGATYNGFLGEEALGGTFTLVVKKPKKGQSEGKATLTKLDPVTGKKMKTTGTVDVLTGEGRGALAGLVLGAKGLTGTFEGFRAQGAVDAAKAKDVQTLAVMNAFDKKLYSLVYETPAGDLAMLTATFAKKGKVKIAGTVGGAKVSGSTLLNVGDRCAAPFVWTKKGKSVSFVLWFDKSTKRLIDVSGMGVGVAVVAAGSAEAPANGSYQVKMAAADVHASVATAIAGTPYATAAVFDGKKFNAGKSAKVALDKASGAVTIDTAKGANVSGLDLKYAKGTLTGSFTVYAVTGGKLAKNKFKIAGVVVDGVGYATATNKKLRAIPVVVDR